MKLKRPFRRLTFHALRSLSKWAARGGPPRLRRWGESIGILDYYGRPGLRSRLVRQINQLGRISNQSALQSDPRELLKTAYRVNDRAFLEIMALYSASQSLESMLPPIVLHHAERLRTALAGKNGVIILGLHSGNGVALAHHLALEFGPVNVVYRESRKVEPGFFAKGLSRVGLHPINAAGPDHGFRQMLKALHRGEMLFILMDQGQKVGGIGCTFLGKQVSMPQGPAELARRTGAPVVPMALSGVDDSWSFTVQSPIAPDDSDTIETLVGRLNAWMESQVLAEPQWWSWHHRRWHRLPFDSSH